MIVEFTPDELRMWAHRGVDRRCSAIEAGRKGAHGFNRDDFWQIDIEGLLAEAAVAKAVGVYYAPITGALDTTLGDILPGVQIRSTKYDSGSLLVHDSDHDDHRFILVTGASGKYRIAGWCYGREGKDKKFWKTYKGRSCYWVPQNALRVFRPKAMRTFGEQA